MEATELICAVEKRRHLWDKSCEEYFDRSLGKSSWEDISNELGVSVEVCKTKWNNLRDTYRREFKKIPPPRAENGKNEKYMSKWTHYQRLSFLFDQVLARDTNDHMDGETRKYPSINKIHIGRRSLPIEELKNEKRSRLEENRMSTVQNEKRLKLEEIRIAPVEKKSADSDRLFLLSLLPYLKAVPYHRKLLVRHQLQNIFIKDLSQVSDHEPPEMFIGSDPLQPNSPMSEASLNLSMKNEFIEEYDEES